MKRFILSAAVVLLAAQAAWAAPVEQLLPMTIKTTLMAGKTYNFTFSLWDGPNVTANKVWEEGPISIKVKNDQTIKHVLGSDTAFAEGIAGPVDFSQQMWVRVEGGKKNFWVKLTAQPYALGATPAHIPAISCPYGQYLVGIDASGNGICGKWEPIPPRFEFVSTPMTWADAKAYCEQKRGHLATISSMEENETIVGLGGGNYSQAWLGGYQAPGTCEPNCGWQLITGESFSTFANWLTTEPDNWQVEEDCLSIFGLHWGTGMESYNSYWNDWICTEEIPFYCEY